MYINNLNTGANSKVGKLADSARLPSWVAVKQGQTLRTLEDREFLGSEAEEKASKEPEKGNKSNSSLESRTLDSSQWGLPCSPHLKPLFLVKSKKIIHITTRAPQVSGHSSEFTNHFPLYCLM